MKRVLATCSLSLSLIAMSASPAFADGLSVSSTTPATVIKTVSYVSDASFAIPFAVDVPVPVGPSTDVSTPGTPELTPEEDALLSLQPDSGLVATGGDTPPLTLSTPPEYIQAIGTYPPEDQTHTGSGYVTSDSCYFYVHGSYTAQYWNGALHDVTYDSDVMSDCSSFEPFMQSQSATQRGGAGLVKSGWTKCSNCQESYAANKGSVGATGTGNWYTNGTFTIGGFKGQKFTPTSGRCSPSPSGQSVTCNLRTSTIYIPPAD